MYEGGLTPESLIIHLQLANTRRGGSLPGLQRLLAALVHYNTDMDVHLWGYSLYLYDITACSQMAKTGVHKHPTNVLHILNDEHFTDI